MTDKGLIKKVRAMGKMLDRMGRKKTLHPYSVHLQIAWEQQLQLGYPISYYNQCASLAMQQQSERAYQFEQMQAQLCFARRQIERQFNIYGGRCEQNM